MTTPAPAREAPEVLVRAHPLARKSSFVIQGYIGLLVEKTAHIEDAAGQDPAFGPNPVF
jgi:hypothetical protein